MSASLVGSEMCIRDSPARNAGTSGPLFSADSKPWTRTFRPVRPAGGCSPVSYTHLTLPTICSV
eukprot:1933513-Alexandrium_andersonii.AAC.1